MQCNIAIFENNNNKYSTINQHIGQNYKYTRLRLRLITSEITAHYE